MRKGGVPSNRCGKNEHGRLRDQSIRAPRHRRGEEGHDQTAAAREPFWDGAQGAKVREAAARQSTVTLVAPPLKGVYREPEYRRVFEVLEREHAQVLLVSDSVGNNAPATFNRRTSGRSPASCTLTTKAHRGT
jgi:hypothetical protein